jgi:hypothetical protein
LVFLKSTISRFLHTPARRSLICFFCCDLRHSMPR